MRRSVAAHATLIEEPRLDDPALVLRGAAHYDLTCRPCHGGAAGDRPLVSRRMVPPPRALNVHAQDWEPRDLFYIVKHGMKFTGMPPWPAQQRDDEVWAMVAFLRRLPALTRQDYLRLARGEPTDPFDLEIDEAPPREIVAETCARCHGLDGRGRGEQAFPKLAGQTVDYLDRALRAYADGRRHSGFMEPIAAALTAEDREYAARYYAAQPAGAAASLPDTSRVAPGREIATEGVPEMLIPACVECHGPSAMPKHPAYPRLAGQYPEYLAQQLRLLREERRGGSEYVHLMHAFAGQLTDEHIENVTAYFASLPPVDSGGLAETPSANAADPPPENQP